MSLATGGVTVIKRDVALDRPFITDPLFKVDVIIKCKKRGT